jgi:hypothetical protein
VTHPFERWPRVNRRRILLAVVAAAIEMLVLLAILDAPLRKTGDGTIGLPLAGTAERAQEIVASWRAEGVLDNALDPSAHRSTPARALCPDPGEGDNQCW